MLTLCTSLSHGLLLLITCAIQEVDFALGGFTITRERLQVVEFSPQYMVETYLMVMKKPKESHTSTFLYMEPFDRVVWFWIIVAIMGKYLTIRKYDKNMHTHSSLNTRTFTCVS